MAELALGSGLDRRIIGLGIALGIGLLVGLQREWAADKPVGLRSFALISSFGGLSALVADGSAWVLAAGVIALGVLLSALAWSKGVEGVTTLLACLVVYLLGAAAVAGYWPHAIVLGGVTTLLLHWKSAMHGLVSRLGAEDLETIARFVLIALVILPVMPARTFGPYDVFNPFVTWLLVVLIVGMNLAGYLSLRLVGAGAGGWLAGGLGGMISSTATTVSYARLSRERAALGPLSALVILVASAVVYVRIALELLAVAPNLLRDIAGPSIAFTVVLLGLGALQHRRARIESGDNDGLLRRSNPAQIRLALGFAALYVLILFAVAAARDLIGDEAVLAVAFLSGLSDVDAITLSIGQMYGKGAVGSELAWRAIFLASLSNLAFKTAAAMVIGSAELRRCLLLTACPALVIGAALIGLWP